MTAYAFAGGVLAVLYVLAALGAVLVVAEGLWRLTGWLARRDER